MDITSEHWNVKNGELKGLWTVNTDAIKGDDLWSKLDAVIYAYTKLHPMEMEAVVRQNGWEVQTRMNEHGSTKNKSLRYSLSMPVALMFKCEAIEPNIFNNKKLLHGFMKRYKGLRVCESV